LRCFVPIVCRKARVAAVFWTAAAFVFTVTFLGFGGAKPKSANRSTASLPLVATR